jgi:hypothetical protein
MHLYVGASTHLELPTHNNNHLAYAVIRSVAERLYFPFFNYILDNIQRFLGKTTLVQNASFIVNVAIL